MTRKKHIKKVFNAAEKNLFNKLFFSIPLSSLIALEGMKESLFSNESLNEVYQNKTMSYKEPKLQGNIYNKIYEHLIMNKLT